MPDLLQVIDPCMRHGDRLRDEPLPVGARGATLVAIFAVVIIAEIAVTYIRKKII